MTVAQIEFRSVWPDEYGRVSRLFARPIPHSPDLHLMVAVKSLPREQILSGAAVIPYKNPESDADSGIEGRLYWASQSAYRGSDTELEVIRYACADAERLRLSALVTEAFFPDSDPVSARLLALGFHPSETIEEYEAAFDDVWNRCSRIYKRLRCKGAIPANAQITGLQPSILSEVRTRLHKERIMDTFDFDARLMPGHPQRIDLERSTAIRLDERLVGTMVVAPMVGQDGYMVTGRWVSPEYRRGWLNAVLIHNSVRECVELNLAFVRFVANSRFHSETRTLAKRLGGHSVSTRHRYTLVLANDHCRTEKMP